MRPKTGIAARPRIRSFRPGLESLEDRRVLSTYSAGAVVQNAPINAPAAQVAQAPAPNTPAAQKQAQQVALGRLWTVLSLTKNADQAPWLSLQFGKGKDAEALKGQPATFSIDRMGVSWGVVMTARPLIVAARILFDEARHVPGKQQGELVKQGNALLAGAKGFIKIAERLWAEMWAELWRRPGSPAAPETKPVPLDVWIGLTQSAQAQEIPNQLATKVEDITWKPGSKWYIYESLSEYKRLTGKNHVPPNGAGAVTFRAGKDVVTIFASLANMQNKGYYGHERGHMIIFTDAKYQGILGDDIISKAKREQLAYYEGWQAAQAAGDKKTAASQYDRWYQTGEFLSKNYSRTYDFIDGNEIIFLDGKPILVPKK